jgi:23S rRNA (uridine2552-2'-O)-methyltransferase
MGKGKIKGAKWQDHYSQRAKSEHYPARSVYKLKEIQKKFRVVRKGDKVLDLGCSPGSWLMAAAEFTGAAGRIVGLDLQPVELEHPPNVKTYTADALGLDNGWLESLGNDFNVVLSDLAPATTGNKTVDAARSLRLCEAALHIAETVLIPGGRFVCKIFQGAEIDEFVKAARGSFRDVRRFKPQSSRKASKEIFVIALGYQKPG